MELNIGVHLELEDRSGTSKYFFQNYKVGGTVVQGETYTFAPFSFGGAVTNFEGDNIAASVAMVSNEVTRSWAEQALREGWIATAQVLLSNDDSTVQSVLYTYVGAVASGGWGQAELELTLTGIMDAARGSVPARKYIRELVGRIPITASINV